MDAGVVYALIGALVFIVAVATAGIAGLAAVLAAQNRALLAALTTPDCPQAAAAAPTAPSAPPAPVGAPDVVAQSIVDEASRQAQRQLEQLVAEGYERPERPIGL